MMLSFKKLGKLLFVYGLVFALSVSPVQAADDDIVINLAYAGSKDSAYGRFVVLVKKHAEKLVKGVTIKLRCCASLITEDEAFTALQLGTVDMAIITGNNVSPHYPLWDAFVLPYIFYDRAHGYRVLDGSVGSAFRDSFEQKTHVYILGWGNIGYRDFYNTVRPINTMADMAGIKIRVPQNEVMIATYQEFGASPIPLPWSETPAALQLGVVQGGDNGITFVKSLKFYKIASNLAILEHFAFFSPLFASSHLMNKLSPEQRDGLRHAAHLADIENRELAFEHSVEVHRFLAEEGKMKITEPDRDQFILTAQKIQNEWLLGKGFEFWKLVKSIRATE